MRSKAHIPIASRREALLPADLYYDETMKITRTHVVRRPAKASWTFLHLLVFLSGMYHPFRSDSAVPSPSPQILFGFRDRVSKAHLASVGHVGFSQAYENLVAGEMGEDVRTKLCDIMRSVHGLREVRLNICRGLLRTEYPFVRYVSSIQSRRCESRLVSRGVWLRSLGVFFFP